MSRGSSSRVTLGEVEPWTDYYRRNEAELRTIYANRQYEPLHQPNMPKHENWNEKVSIWSGPITKLEVDCIVNAAHTSLLNRGGGVEAAIHQVAGPRLLRECRTLRGCDVGHSKITEGYNLPAKYVIHTVGPTGISRVCEKLLASCYKTSFEQMLENGHRSIAFPCVSTGNNGFPNERAAHIALTTTRNFLEKHERKVDRVVFCMHLDVDKEIYKCLMQHYFPMIDVETRAMGKIMATLKVSPEGKFFKLGDLYNSYSNEIVPGMTLWDEETLRRFTQTQDMYDVEDSSTEPSSSTSGQKSKEYHLKLAAVLFGIDGKKESHRVPSTTRKKTSIYHKTIKEQSCLNLNQLLKQEVLHTDLLDSPLATHMVTAIDYGFERKTCDESEITKDKTTKAYNAGLRISPQPMTSPGNGAAGSVGVGKQMLIPDVGFGVKSNDEEETQSTRTSHSHRSVGSENMRAVPIKVHMRTLAIIKQMHQKKQEETRN